jgi:hypothetical protein
MAGVRHFFPLWQPENRARLSDPWYVMSQLPRFEAADPRHSPFYEDYVAEFGPIADPPYAAQFAPSDSPRNLSVPVAHSPADSHDSLGESSADGTAARDEESDAGNADGVSEDRRGIPSAAPAVAASVVGPWDAELAAMQHEVRRLEAENKDLTVALSDEKRRGASEVARLQQCIGERVEDQNEHAAALGQRDSAFATLQTRHEQWIAAAQQERELHLQSAGEQQSALEQQLGEHKAALDEHKAALKTAKQQAEAKDAEHAAALEQRDSALAALQTRHEQSIAAAQQERELLRLRTMLRGGNGAAIGKTSPDAGMKLSGGSGGTTKTEPHSETGQRLRFSTNGPTYAASALAPITGTTPRDR